jgi:hypothetical protein
VWRHCGVASAAAIQIVLGIAEVLFQFEFQESLERVLHQLLKQLLRVDRLRAAAGPHLVHQQFLEIGGIFRAGGECRLVSVAMSSSRLSEELGRAVELEICD